MSEEIWQPVVGYEGYYSVSNLGRVRRDKAGMGARPGYILKVFVNANGYTYVNLRHHSVAVHRVVMAAFAGPRCPGMEVNHKNGIKTDNAVCNLEYVTHGDNLSHAFRIGLVPRLNGMAKLTESAVREIRAALARGEQQRNVAHQFRVANATICRIARGRSWRHVA